MQKCCFGLTADDHVINDGKVPEPSIKVMRQENTKSEDRQVATTGTYEHDPKYEEYLEFVRNSPEELNRIIKQVFFSDNNINIKFNIIEGMIRKNEKPDMFNIEFRAAYCVIRDKILIAIKNNDLYLSPVEILEGLGKTTGIEITIINRIYGAMRDVGKKLKAEISLGKEGDEVANG